MAFAAPIPIRAQLPNWERPTEADSRAFMSESPYRSWLREDLLELFRSLRQRYPRAGRTHLIRAALQTVQHEAVQMQLAPVAHRKVKEIVSTAAQAVASFDDVETIDDFFVQEFAYTEPRRVYDLLRTELGGIPSVSRAKHVGVQLDPERSTVLMKRMSNVVQEAGLEKGSFNFNSTLEHLDRPPCWHPEGHRPAMRKRGPPKRPLRRASTWGTYALAWLVGSETLAVNWWNRLITTPEARWGSHGGTNLANGLAKYVDAKQRLVDDMQGVIPRNNPFKPSPRIDRLLEILIEFTFGWRS